MDNIEQFQAYLLSREKFQKTIQGYGADLRQFQKWWVAHLKPSRLRMCLDIWLNMAEIELSILSRQCINRRISNKKTLVSEVVAWEKDRNNLKVRINWQFKPDNARIKLKRLYPVSIIKNPS